MESLPKRQRLESPEERLQSPVETTSYRLSPNRDCVLKILEWLELDQLCVLSTTCKMLQNLVGDFFRIKYQNKIMNELRIEVTVDGKICLSPLQVIFCSVWKYKYFQDYATYFTKYMQNITIGGSFRLRPLDVTNFIRAQCNSNIREIAFEEIKLNPLHGALIIDWLKDVEKITFFGCESVHHILQYCKKIKYLKVDKYSKDRLNRWMIERYPTLKYLQYDMGLPSQKLLTFLRTNPNIKSLLWEFDRFNQPVTTSIIHQLSFINLEQLLLTLDDLVLIVKELIKVCEGDRFKRLQLCFNNVGCSAYHFSKLKLLKCLQGLHLLSIERDAIPQDVVLEHLKVLHCSYILKRLPSIDALSKNLPNLEELYLMELGLDFKEFVAPFVRNSVKLNKIVARDFKRPDRSEITNFRLAKYFNDEREQLLNACKLIIYIGKDEFDGSFDLTPSKCPLVEIRKVEFQSKRVDHEQPYLRNFAF